MAITIAATRRPQRGFYDMRLIWTANARMLQAGIILVMDPFQVVIASHALPMSAASAVMLSMLLSITG